MSRVASAAAAVTGVLALAATATALAAAPANDDPAAATPVTLAGDPPVATIAGDTTEATITQTDPLARAGAFNNTIWFRVHAPRAGTLVADTCASASDTALGLFTVAGELLTLNDDGGRACPPGSPAGGAYAGTPVAAGSDVLVGIGQSHRSAGAPVTLRLRYDDQPPVAQLLTGPPPRSNDSTATFTFSAGPQPGEQDIVVGYECGIDTLLVSGCTPAAPSTLRFTNVREGAHTLLFRVFDAAGNPSSVQQWDWITDLTPPVTRIDAAPTGSVTSTSAVITFSSEQGARFECTVDDAARAPCTSPLTLGGLAPGRHTVLVSAIDAAGNRESSPESASWFVDVPSTDAQGGPAPRARRAAGRLVVRWARSGTGTRLRVLRVAGAVRGTTVTVRCTGGGCPVGPRALRATRAGTLNAGGLLARATLRRGALVAITLSQRHRVSVTTRFVVGAPGTARPGR